MPYYGWDFEYNPDAWKKKKAAAREKFKKYKEVCQQWHDKVIDWNTYCRLSKKYYQSPSVIAAYGL